MKTFGDAVRQQRTARGMSQKELADRAGTSQATIEKIENGKSHRSRYLPVVFSVLGLPLGQLGNRENAASRELTRVPLGAEFPPDGGDGGYDSLANVRNYSAKVPGARPEIDVRPGAGE